MNNTDRNRIIAQIESMMNQIWEKLGEGLPLATYRECLIFELRSAMLSFRENVVIPVTYKYFKAENQLKVDLLIENEIPVEIEMESSEAHRKMMAVLRHSGKPIGLLITLQVKPVRFILNKITYPQKIR